MSCLSPVVRKAKDLTHAQFEQKLKKAEQKLAGAILKAWNAQTKKATTAAIKAIEKAGKNIDMLQAQAIANGLTPTLGKEFAEVATDNGMVKHIHYAYDMAGIQTATEMMLPYALTFQDQKAKDWLAKDLTYWIGNFYNDHIKEAIVLTVEEYAINQGQNHWVTGQRIKDILGGTYDIPPKYLPTAYVRAEAYWQGMAATAVTRATVLGRIEPMLAADVTVYEIISAGDRRVCPVCRHMNGKKFRIEKAVEIRDKILAANTPDDVKAARPWPKYADIKDMDAEALAKANIALPDFHYFCRCDYVAHTFKEYDKPVPVKPEPVKPKNEVPKTLEGMKQVPGADKLGGAGKKHLYQAANKDKFIFKPAYQKGTTKVESFRAYAQEVASNLAARLFEPGQFIEVRAVKDANGVLGTLQKLQPDVEGDLKKIPWTTLNKEQIAQIQQEHVLDWVIGNFDSHPGNFLKMADGRILAVDKEQSLRYIDDPKSWKMSLDYHPNAKYGEMEPIYNMIYRDWRDNKVDLDPHAVLVTIKRLEAIPDDEYRAMFENYAYALYWDDELGAEILLDHIVLRKNQVREQFRAFFTDLYKQKMPKLHKNYQFKFIDEMAANQAKKQPVSATTISKAELQKMTVKTLKEMAKAKGIKYFQSFKKDELVEALADTDQAPAISMKVKERIKEAKNVRVIAPGQAKKPEKKPSDVFEDISIIRPNPYGTPVKKDAAMLEGQQLIIRRIEVNGQEGYQITTKITEAFHDDVVAKFKKAKAKMVRNITFKRGYADPKTGKYVTASDEMKVNAQTYTIKIGNATIRFCDDRDKRAIMGHLDIFIEEADGAKAAKMARKALEKLGLQDIAIDPTAEDERILRLARLLWQHAPKAAHGIDLKKVSMEYLETLCKKNKIDTDRVDGLVEKEVFPGYTTYVEEGISKEYKKAGAEYLFAGVGTDPDLVVKIVSDPNNPGLMSTLQRYAHGITKAGASEGSDIKTGGADNAFVRLVTKGAQKNGYSYSDSFLGSGYRLHWDIKELERTDWYAYNSDSFGTTETGKFVRRKPAIEHVKAVNQSYNPANEVMFRKGITMENLIGITTERQEYKESLINAFKRAGITKIKGVTLDKFIQVKRKV